MEFVIDQIELNDFIRILTFLIPEYSEYIEIKEPKDIDLNLSQRELCPYRIDVQLSPDQIEFLYRRGKSILNDYFRNRNSYPFSWEEYHRFLEVVEAMKHAKVIGRQVKPIPYVFEMLKVKFPEEKIVFEVSPEGNEEIKIVLNKYLSIELYHDGSFVLDCINEVEEYYTHWHPDLTEDALNDMVKLIQGDLVIIYKRSIFKQRVIQSLILDREAYKKKEKSLLKKLRLIIVQGKTVIKE